MTPEASIDEAARSQRPVPSKISDNPSSGMGATRLDQTNREIGRFAPADRVTTFPAPHDAAEATPRATAKKGTPWARPAAMTPRPARATHTPATWRELGRSPSATTANGIVNSG